MKIKLHISKTVVLALRLLLVVLILILYLFFPKLFGFEVSAEMINTNEAYAGAWVLGCMFICFLVSDALGRSFCRCIRKYRRLKHPNKPLTVREQAQDLRDLPDDQLVALVNHKQPADPFAPFLSLVNDSFLQMLHQTTDRGDSVSDEEVSS